MEIKLNRAYSSIYDNIEYPILKLSDDSYLCISYSINHRCYSIDTYTEAEFIKQGFKEDEYCDDLFDSLCRELFDR